MVMSTAGDGYLIGLDFGSESARGVLLEAGSGRVVGSLTHAYRHGVMSASLPDGEMLARGWALQVAPDYTEAAEAILAGLGRGRHVLGIGIGFTASSPLPCKADGTPLSSILPRNPHAYVKLWKHAAVGQPHQRARRRLSGQLRRQAVGRMVAGQGRADRRRGAGSVERN